MQFLLQSKKLKKKKKKKRIKKALFPFAKPLMIAYEWVRTLTTQFRSMHHLALN